MNQTFVASGNSQTVDAKLQRVLARSQNDVFGVQFRLSRRFGKIVGTQLAGAVVGVRGSVATHFGGYAYDLFAGTPVYKPSGFETARVTFGFQLTAPF